jgi:hypothetical protein
MRLKNPLNEAEEKKIAHRFNNSSPGYQNEFKISSKQLNDDDYEEYDWDIPEESASVKSSKAIKI